LNNDASPLLQLAERGVAVGYGRVTVASQLIANAQEPLYLQNSNNGLRKPSPPKPSTYRQRLAWLVVVKYVPIFHGRAPIVAGGKGPSRTARHSPAGYGYVVFLIDARTGSDALLYAEAQPGVTDASPASVTIPAEQISVPWTLISRSPGGYAGTIRATVLDCDGSADPPILVDRYRASVAVIVERPVDASCGTPKHVTLALHAAVVTWNLPPRIAHDPPGPYLAVPEPTPPGNTYKVTSSHGGEMIVYDGPDSTGGALWTLGQSDDGATIQVKVGSVLAVGTPQSPTRSSHPAALGLLNGSGPFPVENDEYRAWHTGHADLFVPTSACDPSTGAGMPCTPPWIVHININ
jgi:hypothetical protein